MTGIFGILESSATQWYQDVAPTQEFLFFIVTSIGYRSDGLKLDERNFRAWPLPLLTKLTQRYTQTCRFRRDSPAVETCNRRPYPWTCSLDRVPWKLETFIFHQTGGYLISIIVAHHSIWIYWFTQFRSTLDARAPKPPSFQGDRERPKTF